MAHSQSVSERQKKAQRRVNRTARRRTRLDLQKIVKEANGFRYNGRTSS